MCYVCVFLCVCVCDKYDFLGVFMCLKKDKSLRAKRKELQATTTRCLFPSTSRYLPCFLLSARGKSKTTERKLENIPWNSNIFFSSQPFFPVFSLCKLLFCFSLLIVSFSLALLSMSFICYLFFKSSKFPSNHSLYSHSLCLIS